VVRSSTGQTIVRHLEERAARADDRYRAAKIDRAAARAAVVEARQRYGAS
jgi:hypothetical protein